MLDIPEQFLEPPGAFEEIKAKLALLQESQEEINAEPVDSETEIDFARAAAIEKSPARGARPRFWGLVFNPQLRMAATVVIALGIGWMVGSDFALIAPSPSSVMPLLQEAQEAVPQPDVAVAGIEELRTSGFRGAAGGTAPVLDATLIIPGLTVLEVIFLSEASGGGIRVIQELPDGRPVEIYYRAVPESLSPLSDSDRLEQVRELYELGLQNGWGLEVQLGPRPGELTVLQGPLTETELTDLVDRMDLPNP